MKKVQLNLDLSKVKQFFLQHVEKLALGAIVVCVVWLLYGAYGRETFNRSPEELQSRIQSARQQIQAATWTPPSLEGVKPYVEQVIPPEVKPEAFAVASPWSATVLPSQAKRTAPEVLPVRDLEVAAGYGAFATGSTGAAARDGRSGSSTAGYRWVVIAGIVPFAAQESEFLRRYTNTSKVGLNDDRPVYLGYFIERAEVTSDADDESLRWKKAGSGEELWWHNYKTQREFRAAWTPYNRDVVSSDLMHEELTYPLGPLLSGEWGREVAHSSLPVLFAENEPADDPAADAEAAVEERPQADPDDPFAGPQRQEAAADDDALLRRLGGRAEQRPQAPAQRDPAAEEKLRQARRYRLFRYFDFHVEEGKRYRYRVRLVVQNPNYQMPPQHLQSPELAKDRILVSAWSEPSPVIEVPRANNLVVGPAKVTADEPQLQVIARKFDVNTGADAMVKDYVIRGQVVDFGATDGVVVDPRSGNKTQEKVTLATDSIVVDIVGGERFRVQNQNRTRPAEAVILDPKGRLVYRSELGESKEFNRQRENMENLSPAGDPREQLEKLGADKDKDKKKRLGQDAL